MRRLYLQIYLTFLGVLLLFGLLVALVWWLVPGDGRDTRSLDAIALLLERALLSLHARCARAAIDLQPAEAQHFIACARATAPQDGTQTRRQLARVERLG